MRPGVPPRRRNWVRFRHRRTGDWPCRTALMPLSQAMPGRHQKGHSMHKLALALLLSAALAAPALAQSKEEPKKEAAKVAIPTNTFFKGQTASQYLAGEQLIGVKVTNKDGQTIGTI